MGATYKKKLEKSTFGMRLAKCLKSRLTEKKKKQRKQEKQKKKTDKSDFVSFFFFCVLLSLFFQSFDLYFMFVTVLVQKAMPFVISGQKSAHVQCLSLVLFFLVTQPRRWNQKRTRKGKWLSPPLEKSKKAKNACLVWCYIIFCCCCCVRTTHTHTKNMILCCKKK